MEKMGVEHFVRHLKHMLEEQEGSFVFFLGAGCSISSKIPGAKDLVEQWLPKLHQQMTGGARSLEEWLPEELPGYDSMNPAASYAKVMRRLFRQPPQRQREIERISRKDPGFGYAVLAKLMTNEHCGSQCNFVLTTNFDDMVADALYLYTQQKPLVIVHESLVGFVETSRTRPLVIKLHGDALLEPKNLEEETTELDTSVRKVLADQLSKRGLIFVGYGGNDHSITSFLRELPEGALSWGVYWINEKIPKNDFGKWLQSRRGAVWVNHLGFDELMVLVRSEFGLGHPEEQRFETLMLAYRETFEKVSREVAEMPESTAKKALSSAVAKATEEVKDWWAVELAARKFEQIDPDRTEGIYRQGLERFRDSAPLLYNYATFLRKVRKDMDGAEAFYRRALEVDPNHGITLSAYALFLEKVRKKMEKAEAFYRRALEVIPNHANLLSNYAGYLLAKGDTQKGLTVLQEALSHADRPREDSLVMECQFYSYAHGPVNTRGVILAVVRTLLQRGVRSVGWDFSANIERSKADGHPNVPLLRALAAVIAGDANIATLDAFEDWQNAA